MWSVDFWNYSGTFELYYLSKRVGKQVRQIEDIGSCL